eukprot:4104500-Prymnesium_polylepis.1
MQDGSLWETDFGTLHVTVMLPHVIWGRTCMHYLLARCRRWPRQAGCSRARARPLGSCDQSFTARRVHRPNNSQRLQTGTNTTAAL